MSLQLKQLSSLAKVFPKKIYGKSESKMVALKNSTISYQIAYKGEGEYSYKIKSRLNDYISVFDVGFVPSEMPAYENCDDGNYQNREPGLFPDPLFPRKRRKIKAEKNYKALWISIDIPSDIDAGEYEIEFIFNGDGEYHVTKKIKIEDIALKEKEIIFTQWFHVDCIANYHKVQVYSKEHWELIRKYMKMANEHGINMILVPVLTPPLDTYEGGERTTTQLVDIEVKNGDYVFDFTRLHTYINMARECGMRYFEINHMFTQWGAKHAPKVIAKVNGQSQRIFGWETSATSNEYATFLRALIPALIKELKALGLSNDHVFFHVSDEPNSHCIDEYRGASAILKPLVNDYKITDALSHIEFSKQGLVDVSVCEINSIEHFVSENVPELWGYYCCAQTMEVSNRFFSMSSARNRIIGTQIYKFGLRGFLHWGYNFYNTQFSRKQINPYKITDAGKAFPSGDAFSVYPVKNGVIPSLRLKVFKEALDDVSILYMLEEKVGREEAIRALNEIADCDLTFKIYPRDEEFFVRLRKKVIKMLK